MLHPPPWNELADDDVVRELDHMHQKRSDVFRTGSAVAWRNHLERTTQLEAEYLRRFPRGVTAADEKLRLYSANVAAEG